jgi:tetratricopeptide (TPR) repeat protein
MSEGTEIKLIQSAIDRLVARTHSEEDVKVIASAFDSRKLVIASGYGAVGVGGSVIESPVVTGNENITIINKTNVIQIDEDTMKVLKAILEASEDPLSNKSAAEKADHYNNLGNAQIGINDVAAIECFGKSINYNISLPAPHIGLGTIAYLQGNLNAALGHYRKAESLYEKYPTLADQRQKVTKLIQDILEKQKKSWFM